MRRRSCVMTKKQSRMPNVSVGTVKKSIAAIATRWLLRNAALRFAGSGFLGAFLIQRMTFFSERSKPSIFNLPWMRGAPHPHFRYHAESGRTQFAAYAISFSWENNILISTESAVFARHNCSTGKQNSPPDARSENRGDSRNQKPRWSQVDPLIMKRSQLKNRRRIRHCLPLRYNSIRSQ